MTTTYEFTFPRSGNRPLRCHGQLLAEADDSCGPNGQRDRYCTGMVVQTREGKYIVSIDYISHWQGESNHHVAEVFPDATAAVDWLRAYTPDSYDEGHLTWTREKLLEAFGPEEVA